MTVDVFRGISFTESDSVGAIDVAVGRDWVPSPKARCTTCRLVAT